MSDSEINIINNIENLTELKDKYQHFQKIKISHFLNDIFVENIFTYINSEKNWSLATGIDKYKYEKKNIPQNDKINSIQIKNVNTAFGKDQFCYIFYRSMNNTNMSYFEFILRKELSSNKFINLLNEITNLNLSKLTTLFLSKYKSGNFLSPHSDKGNGRLAFVINLTKYWKPQYGGILHFMDVTRTQITESFSPEFNSFIIFSVPENTGIPHFVSHVVSNVKYSRYCITGWFI
jgi:Rps23 Pro-64 3,4-dihydroxylase Tpa1-like proline 4-hydroxylase